MALSILCVALGLALPLVGASTLQARADASWTVQGCYTDTSSSRTLSESSTTSANMTVASCFAFCSAGGFSLAGVEFGSECYCDYAIQSTGALASAANCNEACSGNSTETCGAGNFIEIYWNGTPPPTTPQQVGTWEYVGCFSDSVSSRQLPHQQTISGGVTVESCTAACKASGFSFAGLEFGQECCACATACVGNTTEFCGGSGKLTVYENPTGQICLESTISTNFNLAAVSVAGGAAASIALHVNIIETVPLISWSILTTASGVFTSEILTNSGLLPKSTSEPQFLTSSLAVAVGTSPLFITTQFPPTAVGPYCTMANPGIPGVTGQVLALNGRSDLWALCPNITASNRMDIVYSPIATNPHYNLASCESVYIVLTD
ncbi:hypothetical protein MSAN_01488600 [Mycena sanguinolenta]|uniref:WSC domain-containing protein n=1 Tax=Mycena sanguinolenta TaxID=230812 RepID=A0A8H7D1W9_9AGAR|nr:hypothetical protein MSAN_01488600 [Mycena sanguinolenta]